MTLQGGDPAYPNGDKVTMKNNTGSAIDGGEVVAVDGHDGSHPTFSLADASGAGDIMGVAGDTAEDGELVNVKLRGAIWTKVESDVVAGNELQVPDSGATSEPLTPGVAGGGGSTGHYALTDATTLQDGNDYAVVALD